MLYVFIGCLAFGAFYSVISLILGGHGFDHGIDHSVGHVGGADGADGAQHASNGPSPFNPLVIASAVTAFGAVGLIANKGFGLDDLWSTIVALGFAGAIGAGIFFGIVKFMFNSQSNSVFSQEDLIETEAEVLTPIPVNGLGEIAYVINGSRCTLSAKSSDGGSIPRGATVIIREIASNAAVVQQKLSLDDIELTDMEDENREEKKQRSNAENN